MEAEIIRVTRSKNKPIIGFFLFDGLPQFITLEEDLIGKEDPIPVGVYTCRKTYNRKTLGGLYIEETFEVMNVPGRSGILIHVGNSEKDTSGCILLGLGLESDSFISQSGPAFSRFLKLFKNINEFKLTVRFA